MKVRWVVHVFASANVFARTCCLCVVWLMPRETQRANPLGLHGTTGLLAGCLLHADLGAIPLMQVRWAEREGSAWRRVRAENPATSFSASGATWIVGRTMFAPTTGAHGQAGSESTPSRSLCSAVFARTPTGVFCLTQPPLEPKDSLEPTPSATRRTWNPWSTWGGKTTERGP